MSGKSFDTINLGIYWDRLISIADEMMQALIRTAFSSTVRETHDCSTTLFDAQGRAVAQATSAIPSFTGTAPLTLSHMLAAYPAHTLQPGDVLLTNDPWMGTGHMFDVSVMRPIFARGTLVGYCMSVSHLPDVGGAGWSPETTEMYQEGLRLPVTRFITAGRRDEWVVRLVQANVRVADQVMGDLMANVACTAVGERLLIEFLDEYGIADLTPIADAILDQSERAMRAALEAVPAGTYRHRFQLEGKAEPIGLACAVTFAEGGVTVDYAGSDPVGPWGMNVPLCYTRAMTGYAIKCLTLPAVPSNDGVMRCIRVLAPEDSIVNAQPPAATAVRHAVGHALYPLLMGALAGAMPERVQAESGGGNMLNVRGEFGGRKRSRCSSARGGMAPCRDSTAIMRRPRPPIHAACRWRSGSPRPAWWWSSNRCCPTPAAPERREAAWASVCACATKAASSSPFPASRAERNLPPRAMPAARRVRCGATGSTILKWLPRRSISSSRATR